MLLGETLLSFSPIIYKNLIWALVLLLGLMIEEARKVRVLSLLSVYGKEEQKSTRSVTVSLQIITTFFFFFFLPGFISALGIKVSSAFFFLN